MSAMADTRMLATRREQSKWRNRCPSLSSWGVSSCQSQVWSKYVIRRSRADPLPSPPLLPPPYTSSSSNSEKRYQEPSTKSTNLSFLSSLDCGWSRSVSPTWSRPPPLQSSGTCTGCCHAMPPIASREWGQWILLPKLRTKMITYFFMFLI